MAKSFIRLFVVFMVASICGCTSDVNVASGSQVEYAEVNLSFFQKTITAMGKPLTRADETKSSLQKSFTRLDVSFFPVNGKFNDLNSSDKIYSYHQTDPSSADFGKLVVTLPVGKYTLVAVASKASDAMKMTSPELVSFPDEKVTDMAYVCQSFEVTKAGTALDCNLKRTVAKFVLQATDSKNPDITKIKLSFSGKCNHSFNPSTGNAIDDGVKTYERVFDVSKLPNPNTPTVTFYTLLQDESDKLSIGLSIYNSKDTEVKALSFSDVLLKQDCQTTYTGPLFSVNGSVTFSIATADFTESGGDEAFGIAK